MTKSLIAGVGAALPKRVMTNADISKIVDTSHEWIVERTGIHARHIAGEGETTRTLGVEAAKKALANAKTDASEVDLIVLATSTPDNTFPCNGNAGAGRSWHHTRCGFRCAGCMLRLCLWLGNG